jgi:hypothetical protein
LSAYWATEKHAACITDDAGKILGERMFDHTGTGLAEMCEWLLAKANTNDASALHVAIEGAAWCGRRDHARARHGRSFDPSKAARPLSRPLHGGRGEGRSP